MYSQHERPVAGVQVEQHGGPDQVLGQVAKQRDGPGVEEGEDIVNICPTLTYSFFMEGSAVLLADIIHK